MKAMDGYKRDGDDYRKFMENPDKVVKDEDEEE